MVGTGIFGEGENYEQQLVRDSLLDFFSFLLVNG
jgi:hypothetical protein